MLDAAKVYKELELVMPRVFSVAYQERELARELWYALNSDPLLLNKVLSDESAYRLPHWSGKLDQTSLVKPYGGSYQVVSVDGSQIYPDRHQGFPCFLLNMGCVTLRYGMSGSSIILNTIPRLFLQEPQEPGDGGIDMSQDGVNCRRTEQELAHGYYVSKEAVNNVRDIPTVFLCDGSLIFWHLEQKDPAAKRYFLDKYLESFEAFYQARIPIAGYISMPKSRELVYLLKVAATYSHPGSNLTYVVDRDICSLFLEPFYISTVFKNSSSISTLYPSHLAPYAVYCCLPEEIARIEFPAWVVELGYLPQLLEIIVDQCLKGRGYPVALAEAHEQAVVKGVDRATFYQLLSQISRGHSQQFAMSNKSLKKKTIGI